MEIPGINKDRKQRVKGSPDLSTLVYGKVPPQARDLEEAILGAILLVSGAFDKAAEILEPETFYVDSHQRIFSACQQLRSRFEPIDTLTVVEQLRKSDELEIIGGPYAIVKLTNGVASAANIDTHCKILFQKYLQREVIRLSGEAIGLAYEDSTDAFELVESLSVEINTLSLKNTGKEYTTLLQNAEAALERIELARVSGNELTGVPSGILSLDNKLQGFQPTDLIIIAARPGVGKSAVAINIARGAAKHPIKPTPVGVFSLEMSSVQHTMRIMAAESEINGNDMKRGQLTDADMQTLNNAVYQGLKEAKIFFDDTASLSMAQLKAKARKMVLKEKVGMIIVDYLQLATVATNGKGTREQEVSSISRDLKQLAKELLVPVIALSQLNRKADGKEPQLSDLRESGAIEQDADIVMFLSPVDETGTSEDPMLKDALIIKVAKFRDGALDAIPARFVRSIQKIFSDESDYERYIGKALTPAYRKFSNEPPPVKGWTRVNLEPDQINSEDPSWTGNAID